MITTLDGFTKKANMRVWEIGMCEGAYTPTLSTVNGKSSNRLVNPERCWSSFELCKSECEKMNQGLHEAYAAQAAWEKEVSEYNNSLLAKIGGTAKKDFQRMISDVYLSGKIETVEHPEGKDNDEEFGVFKKVWVEQGTIGDSGDSFIGNIYANAKGIWYKIPYTC